MHCPRALGWVAAFGLAAGVRAQTPQPSDPYDGPESEELRALRLAELEMFGSRRAAALVDVHVAPRFVVGVAPDAVTSDAPGSPPQVAVAEPVPTGRLDALAAPDLPLRWDETLLRYVSYFTEDPRGRATMGVWLRRLARWGPLLRSWLAAEGLPEDLVHVAVVESGLDPTARSPAGAVGPWQMMREAARQYGLETGHWRDDRMDFERSTRAAARMLADLHRRFGAWELALAAYNMGYGALLRAIRKYNTNDYWLLSRLEAALPFETGLYVAKIGAVALVARNRTRFGFDEADPQAALALSAVEVPGGTPLSLVARATGVPLDEIRALNPALRRGRTPPGETRSRVIVPASAAAGFERAFARLRPRMAATRIHRVRFGESVADVARAYRTTERALRTLNALGDGERVSPGVPLLVPDVEPTVEPPAEPPVVAVPSTPTAVPGKRRLFYRVVDGDRAEEIAAFFGVSEEDLRHWNRLDPRASLVPGMFLQLFVAPSFDVGRAVVLGERDVRVLVMGSDEFFEYHEAQRGRRRVRHIVQPGETMESIAARYGLDVASLSRINRRAAASSLTPGETVIVYVTDEPRPGANPRTVDAMDARPSAAGAQVSGPTRGPSEPDTTAPTEAAPSEDNAADSETDIEEPRASDGDPSPREPDRGQAPAQSGEQTPPSESTLQ
ncbi:MAG: transglycosylase SLT domain-containing protein [Myxococcota bacterium]|nr:transglycosylase SLT domain-containing protein [Myxococcota bacterium]MDW8361626.1 transglycosylase SLT domain-containing protein [Myxococcales bacterium]